MRTDRLCASVRALVTAATRGGVPLTRIHHFVPATRESVYVWRNGGTPSPQNADACRVLAEKLEKLTDTGALPLKRFTVAKLTELL